MAKSRDMMEVTNVVMAGARKSGNLFGKNKLESKDKSENPSGGSGRNGLCRREEM